MPSSKTAILKAILYADIFDYPLTKDEIYWFVTGEGELSLVSVERSLSLLSKLVSSSEGYYFLKGRDGIVPLRKRRVEASKKKVELGKTLGSYLSSIPTVEFIGISGGVGAGNAEENDDIDFFIITKFGALWTTRAAVLLLLQLLGRRRARNASFVRDMACVNMFLDRRSLALPEKMRSIYIAHEVVNMLPIFSRGGAYASFLSENEWVFSFLPNVNEKIKNYVYKETQVETSRLSWIFEKKAVIQLSKVLQRVYMGRKSRKSIFNDDLLAFYPQTFHETVLLLYEEKLRRFGIV